MRTLLTRNRFDHYNGFRVTGERDVKDDITPPSADLPKTDPVVSCVGQRALNFLGFTGLEDYEPPWLVKYGPSQMLRIHHDPSPIDEPMVGENGRKFHRWAILFFYLENDCLGGKTLFPNLPAVMEWQRGHSKAVALSGVTSTRTELGIRGTWRSSDCGRLHICSEHIRQEMGRLK